MKLMSNNTSKKELRNQKKVDRLQKKKDKKYDRENERKNNNLKNKKEKSNPIISNLIPIKDYDDYNNCFVCLYNFEKYYFDILEVYCIDGENMQGTSTYVRELMSWQNLYETYRDDLSIVSLNFPVDVSTQLNKMYEEFKRDINPMRRKILIEKIKELEWLSKKGNERSYFIFISGSSIGSLKEKINKIMGAFNVHRTINIIDKKKKIEVLYKMNNPLAMINKH